MLKLNLKWLALLFVSSLVFIWRLIDFAYEATIEGFHMTRGGFELRGADAEVIELIIIIVSIALIWKAITNIVRLDLRAFGNKD